MKNLTDVLALKNQQYHLSEEPCTTSYSLYFSSGLGSEMFEDRVELY